MSETSKGQAWRKHCVGNKDWYSNYDRIFGKCKMTKVLENYCNGFILSMFMMRGFKEGSRIFCDGKDTGVKVTHDKDVHITLDSLGVHVVEIEEV